MSHSNRYRLLAVPIPSPPFSRYALPFEGLSALLLPKDAVVLPSKMQVLSMFNCLLRNLYGASLISRKQL